MTWKLGNSQSSAFILHWIPFICSPKILYGLISPQHSKITTKMYSGIVDCKLKVDLSKTLQQEGVSDHSDLICSTSDPHGHSKGLALCLQSCWEACTCSRESKPANSAKIIYGARPPKSWEPQHSMRRDAQRLMQTVTTAGSHVGTTRYTLQSCWHTQCKRTAALQVSRTEREPQCFSSSVSVRDS